VSLGGKARRELLPGRADGVIVSHDGTRQHDPIQSKGILQGLSESAGCGRDESRRATESRPRPRTLILSGAGISNVAATYSSVHGKISSAWTTNAQAITLDVTIPAKTTATIYVPGTDPARVTESGVLASRAPGVTYVGTTLDAVKYAVGSGTYHFSTRGTTPTGGRGSR